MSASEHTTDDMLELLDSLDQETRQQAASSSAKTTSAATTTITKGDQDGDDDIMGLLDSLTTSETQETRPKVESKVETKPEVKPEVEPEVKPEVDAKPRAATPIEVVAEADASPEVSSEVSSENSTETEACDKEVEAIASVEAEIAKSSSHTTDATENATPAAADSISSWWSRNRGGFWDSATSVVKQAEAKLHDLDLDLDTRAKSTLSSASKIVNEVDSGISNLLFDNGNNDNRESSPSVTTSNPITGLFNSVLKTIVPPIERHEQLRIHICHDMVGYRAIDRHVYNVFHKVMDQVEGGGEMTMVVQKGQERHRRGSDANTNTNTTTAARQMGIVEGTLTSGKKLAKANLDEYIKTAQINDANKVNNEIDVVRYSNIFISLQPCSILDSEEFFFIVHLADPEHNIAIVGQSQPFPISWANWLDAADDAFAEVDFDPREWVIDWVEDGLKLAVGVCAQKYVIDRMGLI